MTFFYSDGSFSFITDYSIVYRIIFVDYSNIFDTDLPIYMLTIERILSKKKALKFDNRILNTIMYILHQFFSNNENAIIALYDTIDGRQDARKRLFDKWFKQFNTLNLAKLEQELTIDNHKTNATLLYSTNNSNIFLLKQYFGQIVNDNFYC